MDMKPSYEPGQIDKDAPEKIWLQVDIDADKDARNDTLKVDGGITWCWESLGGLEIEYIRADLAAELLKDAERYRWLVKHGPRCDPKMNGQHIWWNLQIRNCIGPTFSDAIDTAMARDREG